MVLKPDPSNALHIYRALLRECTYLPDPAARTYWHTRIVTRFREYNPRKVPWWEQPKRPKSKPVDAARRVKLLHSARKYLSLLRHANAGFVRPLTNILLHTYGRTGKRRHELLSRLLALSATPQNHEAVKTLSAALQQGNANANRPDRGLRLPPSLEAVLKAQKQQPAHARSRKPVSTLKPVIPATNSWGRPFPIRRARNLERKWYSKALASVLPSLPHHEYERLHELASGKLQWSGPVRRRGSPLRLERKKKQSPHTLTPRFMRRLWTEVLLECSTVHWDAVKGKWKVQWGRRPRDVALKEAALKVVTTEGGTKNWMFKGVDESGKRFVYREESLRTRSGPHKIRADSDG